MIRLLAALLLLWAAPALAQQSLVNTIVTAPNAVSPQSGSDLFPLIENGILKHTSGANLKALIGSLAAYPNASLPLSGADSLVVVQGGLNKLVPWSDNLNLGALTVGSLAVGSGGAVVSGSGGLSVTGAGGVNLSGGSSLHITGGSLALSGTATISGASFSLDSLGNLTSLTHTLSPTLQPRNPAGGKFVFYVDAFDKALYVKGWLGTVTKLAKP